jgi:hypothetical protein
MQVRRLFERTIIVLHGLFIRRNCNTEEGSLDCWKETTDGFTYGLSTTMIDFCQTILKIRTIANVNI